MTDFLQLNDDHINNVNNKNNIFDGVEIIVDPDLEDESTVDINNYLGKFILQCRICGNMFPSEIMLDNNSECPICGEASGNGFIYKGKLRNKNKKLSNDEKNAIEDLNTNTLSDTRNKLKDNNIDIEDFEENIPDKELDDLNI